MRDDAKELSHIPGDEGLPIIGRTIDYLRDPWAVDDELLARFGPVFRCKILGRVSVSLASTELVGEALLDRSRNLSSEQGWGHLIGEIFPRGLMLRDFDDHQRDRKIMQVAFRGPARARYHAMLERRVAAQLDAWPRGERLEFYPRLKRCLLEQAGLAFLGVDDPREVGGLLDDFVAMTGASVAVVRLPIPGSAWRRGMQGRRRLEAYFRAQIPLRRGGAGEDLLSVLCRAEDEDGERFDDDAIVDHIIFLLFASHDTTATALTTLIDELSAAPELMEQARAECDAVAARHTQGDRAPLPWAALDELEFVERCFHEALRINPPVPWIMRRTVEACPFGGHALPEHTPLVIQARMAHYDAQLWTDPERFDPERFGPERREDRGHSHAFVPFGGGAHRCIGAEFARQQVRTIVYHLLRRFELQRCEPAPTTWRRLPLPIPADGLPLRLLPRA